jgi:hypothetical protein
MRCIFCFRRKVLRCCQSLLLVLARTSSVTTRLLLLLAKSSLCSLLCKPFKIPWKWLFSQWNVNHTKHFPVSTHTLHHDRRFSFNGLLNLIYITLFAFRYFLLYCEVISRKWLCVIVHTILLFLRTTRQVQWCCLNMIIIRITVSRVYACYRSI